MLLEFLSQTGPLLGRGREGKKEREIEKGEGQRHEVKGCRGENRRRRKLRSWRREDRRYRRY